MNRLLLNLIGVVAGAGLVFAVAVDAAAQRPAVTLPAVQQSVCTVDIRIQGEQFVTGLVGAREFVGPLDRRTRRVLDGPETASFSWGATTASADSQPCTSRQLSRVSAADKYRFELAFDRRMRALLNR